MSRLASSKTPRFGPNGSTRAGDPMLPSRQAYPGRRFALPWAISFCPFGADGSGAGQRPEARGNSQTAGKLWCDPPQVSQDHDACRFTQNAGTVPAYFLRCALVSIPVSQGDPAYVSLSVLENRQNLGRTIQCFRRASVPRAALRSALGYLLLPLWGGRIDGLERVQ
jgi:hypothetical protein